MPPLTLEPPSDDTEQVVGPLSEAQRNRLAADLLRRLRHGTNRAFLRHARLAPIITTPLFATTVLWCAMSCEPTVARRARYVLNALRLTAPARRPR
jgi:hypothetical protein